MILTGRPVDAKEAALFGLANRVVEGGRALAEAQRWPPTSHGFPKSVFEQIGPLHMSSGAWIFQLP